VLRSALATIPACAGRPARSTNMLEPVHGVAVDFPPGCGSTFDPSRPPNDPAITGGLNESGGCQGADIARVELEDRPLGAKSLLGRLGTTAGHDQEFGHRGTVRYTVLHRLAAAPRRTLPFCSTPPSAVRPASGPRRLQPNWRELRIPHAPQLLTQYAFSTAHRLAASSALAVRTSSSTA